MYMCTCVCIIMHLHMCVFLVCIFQIVSSLMSISAYTCLYLCVYVCLCVCVCACVRVCVCACMLTYADVCYAGCAQASRDLFRTTKAAADPVSAVLGHRERELDTYVPDIMGEANLLNWSPSLSPSLPSSLPPPLCLPLFLSLSLFSPSLSLPLTSPT